MRLPPLLLLVSLASLVLASCSGQRLESRGLLAGGEPLPGPDGSYELVAPTEGWVRIVENEAAPNVDLSLARVTSDAWLNVSVLLGRFSDAEAALTEARAQAEALLSVSRRAESDVAVPAPGGDLHARLGEYCGTFDRELRSPESCILILAAVRGRTAWVLVGQARTGASGNGSLADLTTLVRSLRIVAEERP